MDAFEAAGTVDGTALRFTPIGDGRLTMTVMHRHTGGQDSVILRPEWLRPLAAWFAGEARPGIVGHDEYGMPYGCWLAIGGDESAVVTSTHTEALLDCPAPFDAARVRIGVRRGRPRFTARLSPEARQEVAAHLRRTDAGSWTRSAA